MKLKIFLFIIIAIPVFLILIWIFAIPSSLIQDNINHALKDSGNGNIKIILEEHRKGPLFSLYANRLIVSMDNEPALEINNFSSSFTPRYITNGQIAFVIDGEIGSGTIEGIMKLPMDGKVTISKAELNAIPYIARFSSEITGQLSTDIFLKNDKVHSVFEISDLDIQSSPLTSIPLLKTYQQIQGSISIVQNKINFDSVGLEGRKGYARLKGNIANGLMNLNLELMPTAGSLNAGESLLLGRYTVSPGYYVIPIKGPLN